MRYFCIEKEFGIDALQLKENLIAWLDDAARFDALDLDKSQIDARIHLRQEIGHRAGVPADLDPIARSDRESEVQTWLDGGAPFVSQSFQAVRFGDLMNRGPVPLFEQVRDQPAAQIIENAARDHHRLGDVDFHALQPEGRVAEARELFADGFSGQRLCARRSFSGHCRRWHRAFLDRPHGLTVRPRRRFVATTDSDHDRPIFYRRGEVTDRGKHLRPPGGPGAGDPRERARPDRLHRLAPHPAHGDH